MADFDLMVKLMSAGQLDDLHVLPPAPKYERRVKILKTENFNTIRTAFFESACWRAVKSNSQFKAAKRIFSQFYDLYNVLIYSNNAISLKYRIAYVTHFNRFITYDIRKMFFFSNNFYDLFFRKWNFYLARKKKSLEASHVKLQSKYHLIICAKYSWYLWLKMCFFFFFYSNINSRAWYRNSKFELEN